MRFVAIKLVLFVVLCVVAQLCPAQGTLLDIPPHSSNYNNMVRGYWFTAPTNFTIVGLRVPTDASTGPQSIHLMSMPQTPPVYAASTTTFTTLHYTASLATSTVIPVNIPVSQGTHVGILGQRDIVTS
jgi:hypothetical protein